MSMAPGRYRYFLTCQYCNARDMLHVFVAQLTGYSQSKRSAVWYREVPTVHSVGDQRLWWIALAISMLSRIFGLSALSRNL
jgi:hypothetical protein